MIGPRGDATRAFVAEYLFVALARASAESLASENAARLEAMQRAEGNIDELLHNLQLSLGRERQARIDEELFDLVAAYEGQGQGPGVARRLSARAAPPSPSPAAT